ncbi:MAG TPA: fumarylacetoacetate hydrolase family protein [Xanthobacteraceae bacterium]|nr:fumarylacetoacetate hydrolase family protein [Xanthobacteraceae bacterium]
MKLASFRYRDRDRIGFSVDGFLVDLADVAKAIGVPPLPADMIALIESGEQGTRILTAAAAYVANNPEAIEGIDPSDIEWHPPVRRPSKILGIALNNSASDERKISAPDHPLFFMKPASSLVGHRGAIVVHEYYGSVHPEPELAVVIGRHCRDVPAADALDVVYGYSILNDMTGNAMRSEDRVHYYALYPKKDNPNEVERVEQHLSYAARYKGADTFAPMGPWLVTRDEVPDPHALEVRCWHKDELIAEDSTAYYKYPVPEAIAFITRFHSLWPGDVIAMGTAFRPGGAKRSLHTADVTKYGGPVKIEVTGLGTLENPVMRYP